MLLALAGLAVVVFVVLMRDPADTLAIATVIVGASVFVASVTALVSLALEERWAGQARPRGREPRRRRALRRGLSVGALVAALALLRAVDGLTILTGGFVVAGFALAELVLSARPAVRSG
ncbi:MAG: hypothetical protein E6H91_11345 [Chloroflexi bacterium]|nr:MAG: hypothetical protein E6H91_11345 [Chloroflexota bacterium]